MKNKNTLLYDFMEIYKKIGCDSLKCNCRDCSKYYICDLIDEVIASIIKFY